MRPLLRSYGVSSIKYGALHFNIVFFGHLVLGGITTKIFLNRQDNAEIHLLSKDLRG